MWFFEELNESEKVVFTNEVMSGGEILNLRIDFIFIVLEVGIGYRIVSMLLVKACFSGESKNWFFLINFYCYLELEVSVFIIF